MNDNHLAGFLLAGGTNLALRLGHRKSIDLDIFSYQHFDALSLSEHLTEKYQFKKQDVREKDTIKGYIAYLSTHFSLIQMLDAYGLKYKNSSVLHAARGLAFFDDIDFNAQVELTNNKRFNWQKIKKRILEMIKYEDKLFQNEPI